MYIECQALGFGPVFKQPDTRERWHRENGAWHFRIVGPTMVAFQHVACGNVSVHARDRRQLWCSRPCCVASGVHRWVRCALQILVHRDAERVAIDASFLEPQVVDLRHSPRAMYREIGVNRDTIGRDDASATLSFLDAAHFGPEMQLNAKIARGFYEMPDQIGIEPLEWSLTSVDDMHLCACARRDVSELER